MLGAGYPIAGGAGFAGLVCRWCPNLVWFLFLSSGLLRRGGSLNLLENSARRVLQRRKPWLSRTCSYSGAQGLAVSGLKPSRAGGFAASQRCSFSLWFHPGTCVVASGKRKVCLFLNKCSKRCVRLGGGSPTGSRRPTVLRQHARRMALSTGIGVGSAAFS